MCNTDLRSEMRIANVRQWEVADAIGVSEITMVKSLRKELDEGKKPVSVRASKQQRRHAAPQFNRHCRYISWFFQMLYTKDLPREKSVYFTGGVYERPGEAKSTEEITTVGKAELQG